MQEILHVHEQTTKIEQAAPGFHIDKKIYVAVRSGFPTRNRAEDAEIPRTMPGRDTEKFIAFFLQYFVDIHGRDHDASRLAASQALFYYPDQGTARRTPTNSSQGNLPPLTSFLESV